MPQDSNDGYVVEIDIQYLKKLHSLYTDFPYLVENIIPPNSNSKIAKVTENVPNKVHSVLQKSLAGDRAWINCHQLNYDM